MHKPHGSVETPHQDSHPLLSSTNPQPKRTRWDLPEQRSPGWVDTQASGDWVADRAGELLNGAKPSFGGKFHGGEFHKEVDEVNAPLAAVYANGRGGYVEMVVPALISPEPGKQEKTSPGYKPNNPERRLAQTFEHYGIENLGGGRIRVTDVGRGGGTIAEGRLYDHWVRRWWAWLRDLFRSVFKSGTLTQGRMRVPQLWASLLTHTRWAHQPGTGRTLRRVENAFPDQPTDLTVSDPLSASGVGYRLPAADQKPRGILLPRDVLTPEMLTPETRMFIRDRLLQNQPLDPRLLVGGVDLEQVFTHFKLTRVRDLADRAGKTTGSRVLGIAQDRAYAEAPPVLLTVAAVDGQLVFYDQAGDYYDTAEALLGGRALNFLPTTGKTRTPRTPSSATDLSTTTWTFLPGLKAAAALAATLAPDETIDILRTYKLSAYVIPEIFRVTRHLVGYQVIDDEGRMRKEHWFTQKRLLDFFDTQNILPDSFDRYFSPDQPYLEVFVRRVGRNTPYPAEDKSSPWEKSDGPESFGYSRRKSINPFRYWTPARPGPPTMETP